MTRLGFVIPSVLMVGAVACLAIQTTGTSQERSTPKKLSGKVTSSAQTKNQGAVLVKKILEVEYAELEIFPPTLQVTATGEVPTGGYSDPRLSRVIYIIPPLDGIQDFILTAKPPAGPAPTVISKVTGDHKWEKYRQEAPWIKGIRIHGLEEGVIEVKFEDR